MAIIFHCEHCGKSIEAPDNAGGKWGKCPACHNKLYVPASDANEELKLAPIDESDEERQKRLMLESSKLRQEMLLEKEDPNEAPVIEVGEKELTKNIILYLRQMANGELNEAENTLSSITPYGQRTIEILDRIALSEIPEPELADVPPQVLSGLIRTLRTKIS